MIGDWDPYQKGNKSINIKYWDNYRGDVGWESGVICDDAGCDLERYGI